MEIEVIHVQNPHLVWSLNTEQALVSESELEVLGLYGIIPAEIILDVADESKLRRCSTWTPGASKVFTEALLNAKKIMFSLAFIDIRTSMLDNKVHKFGEIIITQTNGSKIKLSKMLTKARLAVYDETRFHKRLVTGTLNTKLNSCEMQEVVKAIDKAKRKKEATKQLKEYEHVVDCDTQQEKENHTNQNKDMELTVENLNLHNTCQSKDNRKYFDTNFFKDIDEQSLGRANSRKKSDESGTPKTQKTVSSSFLQKKLDLMKNSLPRVLVIKNPQTTDEPIEITPEKYKSFDDKEPKSTNETSAQFSAIKKRVYLKEGTPDKDVSKEETNLMPGSVRMRHVPIVEVQREEKTTQNATYDVHQFKNTKKSPKEKKAKTPQFNRETEKLVVYGPPDINRSLLTYKVIPKRVIEDATDVTPADHDDDEDKVIPEELQRSDFGEIDSNVDLDVITKKPAKAVTKDMEPAQDDSNIKTSLEPAVHVRKRSPRPHDVAPSNPSTKDITMVATSPETANIKSSVRDGTPCKPVQVQDSDTDEELAELVKQLTSEYGDLQVSPKLDTPQQQGIVDAKKNYVNLFENIDKHYSRFIDKLVTPVLMVHSAMNVRIEPIFLMRDVCFSDHIQMKLKNMGVEKPMTIQTVSWFCVLRGYSLLMISPKGSGKTVGYIPAVCRLLSANDALLGVECKGPMCIIVCATADSVAEVEKLTRAMSGDKKISALYTGMTDLDLTTNLFNGCDVLVCTPSILFRLLQSSDFGIDLRRLSTFVLDDCERLSEVYAKEIVYFQKKIKEMLKNRVEKEVQVQYVVVSRVWCDFMEPLAKMAPNPIVCIGAFQECVLYSRANTTVSFVTKQNKDNSVLEFLKNIQPCKKTVVVCRDDDEVGNLEKMLTKEKYNVLACNNTMDIQELYDLSGSLNKYQDAVSGLILICCDGNVEHLNIIDANYLVHYSMPTLFSMFCKRFSVLNENYASIFKAHNEDLKIKILLEESNFEQLPKILCFIKRCTASVPQVLNEICFKVAAEKDTAKAKKLVPVCKSLLGLGQCPDSWNCRERHLLIKEYDEPKDWMPKSGEITFKILHYQDAISYSARLLTNVVSGRESKYAQNYSKLALNMAMYFATESNRKLHGAPKVGDICAVAVKNNFFSRCQVVEILSYYQRGNPNSVLLKLIDDETLERSRDIYLYHLPDQMRQVETHTIQVRLAGVKPKDKDITFSKLATRHLDAITSADENLYLKGHIALTVGNCVLVDTLETCKDLTFSGTVIRHDLKQELLNRFATANPEHIPSLEKLCRAANLDILEESDCQQDTTVVQPAKELPEVRWAFLDTEELSVTIFNTAIDPETFFVRLAKFEDLMQRLCKDIQTHIGENSEPICNIQKGDIVLAMCPDDGMYERARIDEIIGENKVRCFFVDQGDLTDLPLTNLAPIPDNFVTRLPFQAIECRLFGVRPPGEVWSDFSNIWFTNNLDNAGGTKQFYTKRFTKESAQFTGGYKYGVAIIDTNNDVDVIINQAMVDSNMARANLEEMAKIQESKLDLGIKQASEEEIDDDWESIRHSQTNEETDETKKPAKDPYAFSENGSMSSGSWSCNLDEDFRSLIAPATSDKIKAIDSESGSDSISVIGSPAATGIALERDVQLRNVLVSKHLPMITYPKQLKQDTDNVKHKVVSSPSSSEVSVPIRESAKKGTVDTDNKSVLSSNSSQIRSTKLNKSLDSDDLTSPEPSQIIKDLKPVSKSLDIKQVDDLRKPKIAWRQSGNKIFVKILIIVDKYQLDIKEKCLTFSCNANYTDYGFDIELYGVIDVNNSKHENKGQYILVSLTTVLSRKWFSLTKSVGLKWIVYDVDSLDVSSDEEKDSLPLVAQINGLNPASESEDEDFRDDVNFEYYK